MEIQWLHMLIGLSIGLLMAVTGAGGGIIGVPLLVLAGGLNINEAIPIALMAVFVAAFIGAAIGLKNGQLRYRAALLMALAGVLLSPLGLWLGHLFDHRWLNLLFALLLIVLALRGMIKKMTPPEIDDRMGDFVPCIRDDGTGRFQWTSRCAGFLAVSGGGAGFLSGLLGVGGGFVIVPALHKYTDLNMLSVVATSLAVTMLISFSVVITSAVAGKINTLIAWPFVAGAILGMIAGYGLSKRLNRQQTQIAFSWLLMVVALLMLAKAYSATA